MDYQGSSHILVLQEQKTPQLKKLLIEIYNLLGQYQF